MSLRPFQKKQLLLWVTLLSHSLFAQATCPNCTCVLAATPINFGDNYNPLTGNINDTFGTITAICTSLSPITNASFSLALSTGINSSFNPRLLENGTNILDYNLYSDGSFSQIWGDGLNNTTTVTFSNCTSTQNIAPYSCSHTFTVYGEIPASQTNVVGNLIYLNTLTATLIY